MKDSGSSGGLERAMPSDLMHYVERTGFCYRATLIAIPLTQAVSGEQRNLDVYEPNESVKYLLCPRLRATVEHNILAHWQHNTFD